VTPTGGAEAPGGEHSPAVVTAEGVAPRSIPVVQVLHAMAVATTSDQPGIPVAQVPRIAAQIQQQLHAQLDELKLASPPAGTPAAALQAALLGYVPLADQEAAWNPKGSALPASFFTSLRAADAQWKAAMEQVGTLSGTDLLAKVPPLAMPK